MRETLEAIHQLRADGVISAYAIGGAVGATFYVEPMATMDIGVFVSFQGAPDDLLIDLSPLYGWAEAHGFETRGEYIVLGGWPVQFLPPSDALDQEALARAVETEVEGVKARVMTAEHLVAIALRVGRAKDCARILQFIEAAALDAAVLEDILARHGLARKWAEFGRRFLEGQP
ncbi:MAG: hypothetical protein FJ110_19275 [Deltaproteobacteria bacterium]|nr:hypothetical protein [Deltaproteobacteria bacterium]